MTRIFKNPKIRDQALGFEFVFLIQPQKGAKIAIQLAKKAVIL